MPVISAKVEGLNKILPKLRESDPIYAQPFREAFKKLIDLLEGRVQKRAPWGKGRLAVSVTGKMDANPIPFWGLVTATAENKGFRYPFALEAGKGKKSGTRLEWQTYKSTRINRKTGALIKPWSGIRTKVVETWDSQATLHYRSGRRQGKPTRKWFSGARGGLAKMATKFLDAAAKQIEQRWAA